MGWFWWSIGTQVRLKVSVALVENAHFKVLLCNPLCTLAYAAASWHFFNERIEFEEEALIRFFGRRYIDYMQQVPFTGVPFVHGCVKRVRVVR